MRILVASDTHHDFHALKRAVECQPSAEIVIHLGDGADDAEDVKYPFPQKMFLQVRGNCDWGSVLPYQGEYILNKKTIFYTHGHIYQVKYGLETFIAAARDRHADIALFGHTHDPMTDYRDGLYLMNPGSLSGSDGTYGILDITPAGIVTNILKLR